MRFLYEHTRFLISVFCVVTDSTQQYSGGISRLHLIDLSYVNQNFEEKSSQAPSHAALGQIIYTMLNGNKKVTLFKDSKLTRLLRDSIGNQTCRTTVIAHVSAEEKSYRKTLHTLNITQKIHRKRRKRNKVIIYFFYFYYFFFNSFIILNY